MRRLGALALAAAGLWAGSAQVARAQGAEDEVEEVVTALFDAMRAADSAAVRALFHPEMTKMATSGTREGEPAIGFGDVDGFVSAVGRAEPGSLDEKIGSPDIRIADNLATVITPYAFHYNGSLSHCGVNVFLIARTASGWRIVGLADTRRRQGCEEWLK